MGNYFPPNAPLFNQLHSIDKYEYNSNKYTQISNHPKKLDLLRKYFELIYLYIHMYVYVTYFSLPEIVKTGFNFLGPVKANLAG